MLPLFLHWIFYRYKALGIWVGVVRQYLTLPFKKYLFILCIWVYCSCTDGCEPSCGCWELNLGPLLTPVGPTSSGQLCLLSPCSIRPKDLFIIIHRYTVVDFRCTGRGHQISLQVVVRQHVVTGIWTQDLPKSSQCSYPLSHLASPVLNSLSGILCSHSHWEALLL